MITTHSCKCGRKWTLETHKGEGSYTGILKCDNCQRLIVTWQGPFFYTVKRGAEGEFKQTKATKRAST